LCNERRRAPNRTNVARNAVTCFYPYSLQRPWPLRDLIRPPLPQQLPVVRTPAAVWRVIDHVRRPPYRGCLRLISAGGLRLLAGVRVQVSQIDRARMQRPMRGGTGNQDRAIPLPPRTLTQLRAHWRTQRNPVWRFPSPGPRGAQRATATTPLNARGRQNAFHRAVQEVGLHKPASVPS